MHKFTHLTKLELKRYERQMLLDGWGKEGQKKLKNSTVFIAGLGGLGSSVSLYLAAAGIGKLRVCDYDKVDISNLNRQILHSHTRIGKYKALSAKLILNEINSDVKIEAFCKKIDKQHIAELVGDASVIVDCLDNFPTRYLLNEFAIKNRLLLVHGSIWGFEGRVTSIKFPNTICLVCLFQKSPPNEVFPVVGAIPGVIGCLEAVEVIKYIIGLGEMLYNRLLIFDGKTADFKKLKIKPNPNCPVCARYR